jgi:NAD(P)-dependent dehydrogenase (short-subunit alcohol dehydrogenase family)
MGRFDGRSAIVTGGALGIGGGCARRIAADGGSVLIVDVNEEAGASTLKEIRAAGGTAEFMTGNVAEESVAAEMVEKAVSSFGRLDLLVQNAYGGGPGSSGSAVEIEPAAWHTGMDLLVGAHYLGAKFGVPAMVESGTDPNFDPSSWEGAGRRHGEGPKQNVGRIVNMSSVHGLLNAPRALIYETGKAAVIGLTRQMAVDFGPMGITVNAIAPGHIVTERMNETWNEVGDDAGFRLFELHYPVRRTGIPEDIANVVGFLCSNEASFITGQVLAVDGGMTIQLQEDIVMDSKNYIAANPDLRTHFDTKDDIRSRW